MKTEWKRKTQRLPLNSAGAAALLSPLFKVQSEDIELSLLESGFSNSNYLIMRKEDGAKFVLRILERGDEKSMLRETKINEFLGKTVPQPAFLYSSVDNPVLPKTPFIIMAFVEGTCLEELDREQMQLSQPSTEVLGMSLGAALAAIHKVRFSQSGFLNEMLVVDEDPQSQIDMHGRGLSLYAEKVLIEDGAIERLGKGLTHRFLAFLEEQAGELDTYKDLPCLCHGDFGSSNILIKDDRVTAVLDFEFAFSGLPFCDFGNLLRPPFGERKGIKEAIVKGYRGAGGKLPDNWESLSRLCDLYAWLDFLSRPALPEGALESAQEMIMRTILH